MARGEGRLDAYRARRNFRKTPEPGGRIGRGRGRLYVMQKHDARRLHFDLRLELDGVLKSWAVTRGPSLDPSEKRLAVRTEDHPLEYGGFEGRIPEGYGAGTVLLWDRGEWRPKGNPHDGLRDGVLKFELQGERLKGGFALVRMKPRRRDWREYWLLVKERDSYADEEADPVKVWRESIKTGRGLHALAASGEACGEGRHYSTGTGREIPAERQKSATGPSAEQRIPVFVPPQLATLRDAPPDGDQWLHELKFDGYRIEALIRSGTVRLLTRNRQDWTERYPGIARALAALDVGSALLDGELIAPGGTGGGDFGELQQAAGRSDANLVYYAFDLLHHDGEDLRALTLVERKARLRALLEGAGDPVRYSDHIQGNGRQVFAQACKMKAEGIISKKAGAPYRSGRGLAWLKAKCVNKDEFVIGGYRKSDKRGRPFASLLLGEYEDGDLVYRGRVGSGFDGQTLSRLIEIMSPLARSECPFRRPPAEARRSAVWLKPELVAEIAYAEQTADGLLRQPVFLGVREDKRAREVTGAERRGAPDPLHGVRLTNPDRILYPDQGVTKRQLAEYYGEFADLILPFLCERPLSLVRCPSGRVGKCFFQKHRVASTPDEIKTVMIAQSQGGEEACLVIDSAKGLVAAAQIGALELHIWGARTDRIEQPERLVFDLDPDESLEFRHVRAAAAEMRDLLGAAGLVSFPLITGGKGIHVVVPLLPRRGWNEVKTFARGLARKLAEAAPERYVAQASKKRRKGRIFIDWMRNGRGATAIAPYSTRAHPGAPVAMPVSWEELEEIESSAACTLADVAVMARHRERHPWENYHRIRQWISKAHLDFMA